MFGLRMFGLTLFMPMLKIVSTIGCGTLQTAGSCTVFHSNPKRTTLRFRGEVFALKSEKGLYAGVGFG